MVTSVFVCNVYIAHKQPKQHAVLPYKASSTTPLALASSVPPFGMLGLGFAAVATSALAALACCTPVAIALGCCTGVLGCVGGCCVTGLLAAVLVLGFDAGGAAGGGTGTDTDLGLAARALRLRGLRTAARSAFAAISARACASSAAHMLSLIIRQSSNLPSALMTSFTNIAHLHAVFTQGGE
jgi:hypothetical protein